METFNIKEILEKKIKEYKVDMFENLLYKKVCVLFDIWSKQKELAYLYDLYESIEKQVPINIGHIYTYNNKSSYKEQYISFLMETDLIWIDECTDKKTVLNMIYYWLLADIKKDTKILNFFK